MYQIVIYQNGAEKLVGEPRPYGAVFAEYQRRAALINRLKDNGEYKYPNRRIAIRKIA